MTSDLSGELEGRYLLGIPEIDAQHKALADLTAKFKEVVAAKNQRHLIHPVLRRLYHLLSQHFKYEEMLMDMAHYADLPQHRKTHTSILKLLSDYFDRPIEPGDLEFFGKLIGDKVLGHLVEHDSTMIEAIRDKVLALPGTEADSTPDRSSPETPDSGEA